MPCLKQGNFFVRSSKATSKNQSDIAEFLLYAILLFRSLIFPSLEFTEEKWKKRIPISSWFSFFVWRLIRRRQVPTSLIWVAPLRAFSGVVGWELIFRSYPVKLLYSRGNKNSLSQWPCFLAQLQWVKKDRKEPMNPILRYHCKRSLEMIMARKDLSLAASSETGQAFSYPHLEPISN